jgi:hypothetical protein
VIQAGQRIGDWTVLESAPADRHGNRRWLCRCLCGVEKLVFQNGLLTGNTTQCSKCGSRASAARRGKRLITHGLSGVPEYKVWSEMTRRCLNPNDPVYADYGGRGIDVFPGWVGSGGFAEFIAHLGRRPSRVHSVDRIDNSVGYWPGNVRWATQQQQMRNTRGNRVISALGQTLCLMEWAERTGIKRETIAMRLRLGWEPDRAVSQAVR